MVIDHISRPWEKYISKEETLSPTIHVPCQGACTKFASNGRTPACQCPNCVAKRIRTRETQRIELDGYEEIKLSAETELTEHQYLLCWSHVYGFLLKDREWGKFSFNTRFDSVETNNVLDLLAVTGLKPPNFQENVIDNLVMDQGNKDIIKAVCETYSQVAEKKDLFFADFIRGKGEGQIMLLHGPPGTGKTLTAGRYLHLLAACCPLTSSSFRK